MLLLKNTLTITIQKDSIQRLTTKRQMRSIIKLSIMSYSIKQNENVEKQSQKVAFSQLKKSIKEIENSTLGMAEKIHRLRKRCKKMRALLRVIRPELEEDTLYDEQNQYFKETANRFSATRDKKVLIDSFEKIISKYSLNKNRYIHILKSIESMQVQSKEAVQKQFDLYRAEYERNRKNIKRYTLKKKGPKALDKGLKKGYRKAKKLQKRAYATELDKDFHQWRKWVKYHWYQIRLIEKNKKCILGARADSLKVLAGILGEEHDLSVFKSYLQGIKCKNKVDFIDCLKQEQDTLRSKAKKLGDKLFCEKKKKFIHYLHMLI